jgi:cytochrome bd ubiquinol oxidase subunit II
MIASFDFPTFFACVAGLAVALYVTLDGFDLGVGILFPFAPRVTDRDVMMRSLEPMWDGNETWLVLGGMVLLSAFPVAFSILLPAFYVPLALMLLGLVLRGVAFEFRSQHGPMEAAWSGIFAGGSMLAAFCQGAILGAYVDGHMAVVAGRFAGGPFDWLGLFPVATGLGVMAGYAVLGAGWLIWRTEADTRVFAREIARPALLVTAAAILLVSLWTPFRSPEVAARWFAWPSLAYLAPLPILAAAAWLTAWASLWGRREWLPLVATILLFLLSLIGLAVSVWPAAIPGVMTIWQGNAALRTQQIVAGAIVVIVPIVLGYIAMSYWVFRGKVTQDESGY